MKTFLKTGSLLYKLHLGQQGLHPLTYNTMEALQGFLHGRRPVAQEDAAWSFKTLCEFLLQEGDNYDNEDPYLSSRYQLEKWSRRSQEFKLALGYFLHFSFNRLGLGCTRRYTPDLQLQDFQNFVPCGDLQLWWKALQLEPPSTLEDAAAKAAAFQAEAEYAESDACFAAAEAAAAEQRQLYAAF